MRFYSKWCWKNCGWLTNWYPIGIFACFVCCHFIIIENFIPDRLSIVNKVKVNLYWGVGSNLCNVGDCGFEENCGTWFRWNWFFNFFNCRFRLLFNFLFFIFFLRFLFNFFFFIGFFLFLYFIDRSLLFNYFLLF